MNAGYVLELYERYRQNPESVDPETTRRRSRTGRPAETPPRGRPRSRPRSTSTSSVIVGAANLAESIRRYGHLAAQLDPLGSTPIGDPSLSPRAHGITDDDLKQLPASLVGGPVAESSANAYEAIEKLRRDLLLDDRLRLRARVRARGTRVAAPRRRVGPVPAADGRRAAPTALLDRITQVEVFERFLHRTFPGKTRFSIEGLDMLVPILDEIICGAADSGTRHTMHRHGASRPAERARARAAEAVRADPRRVQGSGRTRRRCALDLGWMGDVKYHAGARTAAPARPDARRRWRRTRAISRR